MQVQFTKWGGGGHWEFPLTLLGRDEHGVWAGGSTGTRVSRPGHFFDSAHDWVSLFPDGGQAWTASFYAPTSVEVALFVDMTTRPRWHGSRVGMVDLDLDVIVLRDGSLFVDDEDEFDEHRVALGYPDDIVALARRTAEEVFEAVATGAEPFGSAGTRWLQEFQLSLSTRRETISRA